MMRPRRLAVIARNSMPAPACPPPAIPPHAESGPPPSRPLPDRSAPGRPHPTAGDWPPAPVAGLSAIVTGPGVGARGDGGPTSGGVVGILLAPAARPGYAD